MSTAPRRGRPKIMAPRRHGPDFSPTKTWEELAKNIREIQNHNAASLSFEENHRYAYNMVIYKHGDTLYNGVKGLVIENLQKLAKEDILPYQPTATEDVRIQNTEEEVLLKQLRKVWDDHNSNMARLGQVLKYMDRSHTTSAGVPTTQQMGLDLFLSHIFTPSIKDPLVKAILNQVRHERDGDVIHRSTVKGAVDVFLSLYCDRDGTTVYKRDLEPVFLAESQEFYQKEGEHLITSCDTPEFLRRVEQRFRDEESRTHHYLSSHTTHPLIEILKDNLLAPHISAAMAKENSGLDVMLDNDKFEDLSRLYRLCNMVVNGIQKLKAALKESIIRRGKEINKVSLGEDLGDGDGDGEESMGKGGSKLKGNALGVDSATTWVSNILSLKDKIDAVWKASFQSNRDIEISLNDGFESFINENEKCTEFISLFIDDNLKKGLKGKDDIEIEAVFEKTITIFRFITDKDMFERYYKTHLAKRLLHGRTVSDDAERGMLVKLKAECGVQFTNKMESMFNDMRISADLTSEYHSHLSKTTAPELELGIIVMTTHAWPITHTPSECVLPPAMARAQKSFEQFYLKKHSGRRLNWQLSLGNADVRVAFKARTHELNVATYALVVLLLFEDLQDNDTLSYPEIRDATRIEEGELKRHLQSLACAKFKILKKHPPGRNINETDKFSFNNDFTCNMKKLKIGTVSSKVENTEERKETQSRIGEERKYQMEACIVRVMKDRKHMKHTDLVHEVTAQLSTKFSPEVFAIKQRIEYLIEKEYLERCEDRKSYNYVA